MRLGGDGCAVCMLPLQDRQILVHVTLSALGAHDTRPLTFVVCELTCRSENTTQCLTPTQGVGSSGTPAARSGGGGSCDSDPGFGTFAASLLSVVPPFAFWTRFAFAAAAFLPPAADFFPAAVLAGVSESGSSSAGLSSLGPAAFLVLPRRFGVAGGSSVSVASVSVDMSSAAACVAAAVRFAVAIAHRARPPWCGSRRPACGCSAPTGKQAGLWLRDKCALTAGSDVPMLPPCHARLPGALTCLPLPCSSACLEANRRRDTRPPSLAGIAAGGLSAALGLAMPRSMLSLHLCCGNEGHDIPINCIS